METFFILSKISLMTDIKIRFWQRVRQLRKQKWISQEKLAQLAGLHRTYIWNIERWEKNVCLENIEKIAKALDVSLKDLFDNV